LSNDASSHKRWLLLACKLMIIVLLVWFVRRTIMSAVDELSKHPVTIDWKWLVLAGALYLVGMVPSGIFWFRLLHALGQTPSFGATMRAFMIGHLGKYVPGKAMVIVLRAGLLKAHRVDTRVAAVSIFLETLTMMAVGAGLSAMILIVRYPHQRMLTLLALGLMVAAGLPTLPPVFRRLVRLVRGRKPETETVNLEAISFRMMLQGWLGIGLGWCLMGLSLWATLRSIGVEDIHLAEDFPLLVAGVALALVAGFLSLMPGGAFVRELILAELMVPRFGSATALVSAVLLRLVWLVAELLISGILYYAFNRHPGAERG
jgi:glycosyltransferase 2 family protein